ncbi:hypothetical protein [Lichenibacterium dinghuense]|uniref:hypothetical protein n=1 Tax=Lichenibacterium dinghuense TaxID=2895977 RepID=UPI001F15BF16|nr:hypothetical protein [Lichenibacterium sp. 6Y81]
MMRTFVVALCCSAFLSGCAEVVPHFDIPYDQDTGLPTVRSIDDKIACELGDILRIPDYRRFLGGMVAAAQLTLTVNDTGGLTPSLTYLDQTFSFGVNATLSQSREQNYTETLYFDLDQLYNDLKSSPGNCPPTVNTNLAGNLGLRETVAMAVQSTHLKNDKSISGTDGEFGGYVNFVVTKSLNGVGPTWALKHFKGPGGLAGVSEVNTDRIAFAFAEAGAGKSSNDKIARVQENLRFIIYNQIAGQLTVINSFSH